MLHTSKHIDKCNVQTRSCVARVFMYKTLSSLLSEEGLSESRVNSPPFSARRHAPDNTTIENATLFKNRHPARHARWLKDALVHRKRYVSRFISSNHPHRR